MTIFYIYNSDITFLQCYVREKVNIQGLTKCNINVTKLTAPLAEVLVTFATHQQSIWSQNPIQHLQALNELCGPVVKIHCTWNNWTPTNCWASYV